MGANPQKPGFSSSPIVLVLFLVVNNNSEIHISIISQLNQGGGDERC